jgi:AAA domain-containing protein
VSNLTPTLITPERCEYHGAGLRFIFTDMAPRTGGIYAWVEVRWQGNIPDPRPLAFGTYNLMGNRTVSTLTSEVMASDGNLDKAAVRELVTEAVNDVRLVLTEQHDAKPLHETETTQRRWTLKPLLEASSITRLIAAGGSLKSLFALAICATVATGSPKFLGLKPQQTGSSLFLDWEADAAIHAERLRALCKAVGLQVPETIHYMRMSGALHLSQRRIASAVADIDPVLLVADSNAMARGASGDGSAEDSTIRMFSALRSFQRSALIVDHKSDEKARRGLTGGYGSIYNRNLARLEWEVNRVVSNVESTDLVLRLEKANNMRRGLELGYRVTIKQTQEDIWETASLQTVNPQSIVAMSNEGATLADRVAGYLRHQTEAQSVKAIANACHLKDNLVRSILSRSGDRFENVSKTKEARWRLIDQETDEGDLDELPAPF